MYLLIKINFLATTTNTPNRNRRDVPNFEWNVKKLIETGSIRPENIANDQMLDYMVTTEIPIYERIKKLEVESDKIPYFGVCTNNTKVITDPKKIYGYYQRMFKVQNPVENVTVSNNVWLKHGDMCNLKLKFHGTSPFFYCFKSISAKNNSLIIQDDENCSEWRSTPDLEINFKHFFSKSSNAYTLFFFLKNNVSDVKVPIGVQFYEGKNLISIHFRYNTT